MINKNEKRISVYLVDGNTLNAPLITFGTLINLGYNSAFAEQYIFANTGTFHRTYSGGSWTEWEEFATNTRLTKKIQRNIEVWAPDYFDVNLMAFEELDGLVIKGTIVSKLPLSANNKYNCFGLNEYPFGTDKIPLDSFGSCNGCSGALSKDIVLMPFETDSRYFQIYACEDIPIDTTFLVNFKVYFYL